MKKNKDILSENYLDKIPVRASFLRHTEDGNGIVTLEKDNKGLFNKIAQACFKKPRVSYIHLDEFGSFVWMCIDGESSIFELGKQVDAHFGEKAQPLYERLAKYFQILESYKFITFKDI